MSLKDAMDDGKEPEVIFHIPSVVEDHQAWRTGMSEETVQGVAEEDKDTIFFVAKEDEVWE